MLWVSKNCFLLELFLSHVTSQRKCLKVTEEKSLTGKSGHLSISQAPGWINICFPFLKQVYPIHKSYYKILKFRLQNFLPGNDGTFSRAAFWAPFCVGVGKCLDDKDSCSILLVFLILFRLELLRKNTDFLAKLKVPVGKISFFFHSQFNNVNWCLRKRCKSWKSFFCAFLNSSLVHFNLFNVWELMNNGRFMKDFCWQK